MNPHALELFGTQELIEELMNRTTFLGVIVRAKDEHKGPWPDGEKAFHVHHNQNLNRDEACRLLAAVSERLGYCA